MLNSLLNKISEDFPKYRQSVLKNVLLLSLCILSQESLCLHKLSKVVGLFLGNTQSSHSAHVKRFYRLLSVFSFSRLWLDLLYYVFTLLRLDSKYLVLDGSSWKSRSKGTHYQHYLTLSLIYGKVAIPILWLDLRKKGVSNQKQRIYLLRKANKYFQLSGKTLLADREYIGKDWFKFLIDSNIDFIIRLRAKNYKCYVDAASGKSYDALVKKVLRSKKVAKVVGKTFEMEGMTLQLVIAKNPCPEAKDRLMYLITNLDAPPAKVAKQYPIRWQIEMCFKHLKSNGFDLEKMNVEGKARQKLLMAILVFAYTISVIEGLKNYKKIPVKKYANGKRYKAISVFRKGLNQVVNSCINLEEFCRYLIQNIQKEKKKYRSINAIIV